MIKRPLGFTLVELSCEVHTHPTLSEVIEVAYKQAAKQVQKSLIGNK